MAAKGAARRMAASLRQNVGGTVGYRVRLDTKARMGDGGGGCGVSRWALRAASCPRWLILTTCWPAAALALFPAGQRRHAHRGGDGGHPVAAAAT